MLNKGSEWSRWDLHIHTPFSIHNSYGGQNEEVWESFITHLEGLPRDVDVIGINDYYFIDGFEKVMEYKMEKNRLQNIEKIFPLLEFRIDTFSSATETKLQKINFHILFNINDADWKNEIRRIKEEFIQQIKVSKFHPTKSLSKQAFTDIGGSLQEGFSQFVPDTDEVLKLIDNEVWRRKAFILIGYKEWNNLDKGLQVKPYKEMLFEVADGLFTASPEVDVSRKEAILDDFGGNVLIHSADIHNFNDLKPENYKCFTWIKAEKTFEGLKQILFEPKERIKIQANNPYYDEQKSVVLDSIQIESTNNWFDTQPIPLNRGLISIIGEKGAGKTALLDLLAIANEEGIYEPDKSIYYSFISRAKKELLNSKVLMNYVGGSETNTYLLDGYVRNESNINAKVRYLSLKELEGYVDEKDKFQDFIKSIIHSKSPELDNFANKIKQEVEIIAKLNYEIAELEKKTDSFVEITKALENKKIELALHEKNEPEIKTNLSTEDVELYKQLITQKQLQIAEIQKNTTASNKIQEIITWIDKEIEVFKESFSNRLTSKLIEVNGSQLNYNGDQFKLNIIVENLELLKRTIDNLSESNKNINEYIIQINNQITPLAEKSENFEKEQQNTVSWIQTKERLKTEIDSFMNQLASFEKIKEQILELKKQRKNHYKEIIMIKINQKEKYMRLKSELESNNNITFKVKIEFNKNKFLDKENAIINHRVGNSQEKISEALQDIIFSKVEQIDNIDLDDNLDSLTSFIDVVESDSFVKYVFGEKRTKDNLMKSSFTIKDFYNWIFDDYFDVNYFIEFKGKPLEKLSPGQKGLVLMKVFLRLDNSTKPLLIDQPEDNLDNKSVFEDLVEDFREIKKKRQIIIATHNPNLVVNTDSEQVIIAKFEDNNDSDNKPKITYISGALENEQIKSQVCSILEGGNDAFIRREKRYSLV